MAHIIPIKTPGKVTILAQWHGGFGRWLLHAQQTAFAIGWGNLATNRFYAICKRNSIHYVYFLKNSRAVLLDELLENFDSLWADLRRLKHCISSFRRDPDENAQAVRNILTQFRDTTSSPRDLPTQFNASNFYWKEDDEEPLVHKNSTKLTWDDFNQTAMWLAERIAANTYYETRGKLAFQNEEKVLLSLVIKKIFWAFYKGETDINAEAILRRVASQCGLIKYAKSIALRALCKGVASNIPYFEKKLRDGGLACGILTFAEKAITPP